MNRRDTVFENRWADGKVAEFPKLAAELVPLKVDVILAGSTPAALAARDATSTIPIVFAVAADPVGAKLIASLSRPGGKASRGATLFNPADVSNVLAVPTIEDSARKLGMSLRLFPVKGAEEIEGAMPRDLPVEQASTFEFVINRKAAKALGLTLTPSMLLRATKVID